MKLVKLTIALLSVATFSFSALAANPPAKAMVCAACHGVDGNPAAPTFPVLAGKKPGFIVSQLKKFKAGKMKTDTQMKNIISQVTDADMTVLAKWFSSQKCKARCNEPAIK